MRMELSHGYPMVMQMIIKRIMRKRFTHIFPNPSQTNNPRLLFMRQHSSVLTRHLIHTDSFHYVDKHLKHTYQSISSWARSSRHIHQLHRRQDLTYRHIWRFHLGAMNPGISLLSSWTIHTDRFIICKTSQAHPPVPSWARDLLTRFITRKIS